MILIFQSYKSSESPFLGKVKSDIGKSHPLHVIIEVDGIFSILSLLVYFILYLIFLVLIFSQAITLPYVVKKSIFIW